ncbi:MAG: PD-(D/E)XK nuclease family protein [Anaerolineae bacterium]|nr:PD-(D/E)XK nuclease family protein [Anaerolineae bacterium]
MITTLLKQVIHLNREYADLVQQERRTFNIFSILRSEDDEVNLHSRFLFELLNPQGTHGMGTRFLELFLEQVCPIVFDLTEVSVQREYQNMDIFIANDAQQAIILENKIYAPDQPKQLLRYYKAVRKAGYRDVIVLYLTLYGDPPGAESAGNLDDEVIALSYADDIVAWLEVCIEAVDAYPMLRETLAQYQRLIEGLTGQALGREIMDIKALLTDEETIKAAISISQALLEIQIDVQFAFWLALEEKLVAAGFAVTEYWKYSRKNVEAYCKKGARRYGLFFNLPELLGEELVAFFIGVQQRVYYGFVPLEHSSPVNVNRQPGFAVLVELLKKLDQGWSGSPSMIGWRPTQRKFDFQTFNTPDVLALIDTGKRDVYLDELVDEITIAIERFYEACESDPHLSDEAYL